MYPTFALVQGPDDGLKKSETCSQNPQQKNTCFALTDD